MMRLSSLGAREVRIRLARSLLLLAVVLATADAQAGEGANAIRADVRAWMLQHNPGLDADFLQTQLPDKTVLLPDGRTVPIYKIQQFLAVNFRLDWKSRKKEGVDLVQTQEAHLRKMMAHPKFYHWIRDYRGTYRISGRGNVSSMEAYNYFRRIKRTVYVTVSKRVHAPVGGGNGINAPSWAVWKQMNLFFHETCHVIGIGHDSGGLSGPLAGKLRDWDQQRLWNYETIDINAMAISVPPSPPPAPPPVEPPETPPAEPPVEPPLTLDSLVMDAGQSGAEDDLGEADGANALQQAGKQHSVVTRFVLTVDGAVSQIDAGAFTLARLGTGGGNVNLNVAWQVADGSTVISVAPQGGGHGLADGNYRLAIDATKIRGGQSALSAGREDEFFCLFGDCDGDRDVDGTDLFVFRRAQADDPRYLGYKAALDYNGDGVVNAIDYDHFQARYGRRLLP